MGTARFATSALLIGAAILSTAPRAQAFDYLEHAQISKRGIDLAVRACASAGSCSPLPGGEARQRTGAEVIASLYHVMNSSVLGKGTTPSGSAPATALARISDIPALSGDYAASPLLVKWRWFNDCPTERDQENPVKQLGKMFIAYSQAEQSPEAAGQNTPNVAGLLSLVRSYDDRAWPLNLAQLPGEDKFIELDDAYATLGERGHPHFRPRLQAPSAELASQRRGYFSKGHNRWKPENHAYAWYADLHLGALEYAALAHRSRLDPARRTLFEGVALLFELSALHYLEDSVSAGHIPTGLPREPHVEGAQYRGLKNGSAQATHDHYSAHGLAVSPGRELCQNLQTRGWSSDLTDLARECGGASGRPGVTVRPRRRSSAR